MHRPPIYARTRISETLVKEMTELLEVKHEATICRKMAVVSNQKALTSSRRAWEVRDAALLGYN